MNKPIISASILSADFARLGEDASKMIQAGADWLHIDVMDNHYVPNLTIGPLVCDSLQKYDIKAPFDIHLMIKPVDALIPLFAKAGATYITFHPEATEHIDRTIELIKDNGCKPGLVFNPATPLDYLDHVIEKLDMILLMSVNPGFAGQSFIPSSINKLKKAKQLILDNNPAIRLEIDGGVSAKNIAQIANAGADTFVMGSALFNSPDYKKTIQNIKDQLPH